MANRIKTTEPEDHHYKVRVVLPGAMLHLASATEPKESMPGFTSDWEADWLDDPGKGDTVGFIDWDHVIALTWRWTGDGR